VTDTRSERIAKAEEGLAEVQEVLDHAKRAVGQRNGRSGPPKRRPSMLVRSRRSQSSQPERLQRLP
jgi:hypothetical protein